MSLINDALKRAKETQPKNEAPAAGPNLRPVDGARADGRADLLLPLLVSVILLLAAVLFGLWWHSGMGVVMVRAKTTPETEQPVHIAEVSKPAVVPPVAVTPTNINANATNVGNTTSAPNAMISISTNVVMAAVEPPKPPPITYKLQSIFYRPGNPSAVING